MLSPRQFWLGCLLSSMLGSGLTCGWLLAGGWGPAQAADNRASALLENQVRSAASRVFNSDGMTPEEAVNVAVYEAVNRSVVNITSKASERVLMMELQSEGSGSGAVLDGNGYILTNNHVIADAKTISVTLHNGETYDAELIGADPINDIAILKIEAPEDQLFPVELGDSRQLKVGMRCFAIGNPFGLERTLTTGVVSSVNRSLKLHGNRTIKQIIQIDAAINPGNSGGPLLDSHGRLIGVNTAIATTTGQSAGVGFAIPVSLVTRVVPQLLKHGRVIRPEVGIVSVFPTDKGLRIAQLLPGGPAEKAGLRGPKTVRSRRGPFVSEKVDRNSADLILKVDDQKISTADDLLGCIEERKPGDEITLTIEREGKKIPVRIKLGTSDTFEKTGG